ncbi:MAG: arginase family protein, partial [Planctomycetota bacterium]
MDFDPDGPAIGDGIFGLPHTREDAAIVLIPVPWEATVSYRGGTALGPAAIRQASAQVDLHDLRFGPVYEAGIFMEDADEPLAVLGRQTR